MPIKVRCRCGRGIKVRDSAAGKRVRCPDCGKPVRIPEPEYEEYEDEEYDEYGDDDYGDDPYGDDDYAPAPRRRKSGGRSTKNSGGGGGVPTPLLIGGGLFVAVLAVAGALYAVLGAGGDDNGNNVAATDPAGTASTGSSSTPSSSTPGTPSASTPNSSSTGSPSASGSNPSAPGADQSAGYALPPPNDSSASPASAGPEKLWVVLSDFKAQISPGSIGQKYQVSYRIVYGTPNPSREYVLYVGSSTGIVRHYVENTVDLQQNGTIHVQGGIGMSGNVVAYIAWKKGRQDWQPVSGEISPGGAATTAKRPPTVQEAAGAAAQGKMFAIANPRFENSRIGRNALVVDFVLQKPFEPGKRYYVIVKGNDGTPMQVDMTIRMNRVKQGEKDQIGIQPIGPGGFPNGNLTLQIVRRSGLRSTGNDEVMSNSVTLRR